MQKVFLLGLDGADAHFIEKHQKTLPVLNQLIQNGVYARLKSTIPPFTGVAWSTITTGMNPGKTGVTDFIENDFYGKKGKPFNSTSIKAPRIWHILELNGLTAGVIAVPLTYPVEKIKGFMISGFLTPGKDKVSIYPPSLKKEICPGYQTSLEFTGYEHQPKLFLKKLYEITEKKLKTVLNLIKKDWQFFTFVISETDWIQHFFWRHPEEKNFLKNQKIILEYFQYVDRFLGKLLKVLPQGTNFFLISDHGFGKCVKKEVFLNTWLKKQGYLKIKSCLEVRLKNLLGQNLREFVKIPGMKIIKQWFPKRLKKKVIASCKLQKKDINWLETQAWFLPFSLNGGYIRINKKILPQKSSQVLQKKLVQKLKNLKDPETKRPLIKEIYLKKEYYQGPFLRNLPEIVFLFSEEYAGRSVISRTLIKKIPPQDKQKVGHRMQGIFVGYGPSLKKGLALKKPLNAVDIAPILYHLIGVALPQEIDGRVLKAIFNPKSKAFKRKVVFKKYPPKTSPQYQYKKQEAKQIKQRLKTLGYLE